MNAPSIDLLFVDDDVDARDIIRQMYRHRIRAGELQFHYAGSGEEALQAIHDNPNISVVLTDVNPPKIGGLELLRNIKKIRQGIYVIIVSAYRDMQNIRAAMNAGAYDFITKPLDFKELVSTVDKTMAVSLSNIKLEQDSLKLSQFRKEMHYAGKLQNSILPKDFPEEDDYAVYGKMTPASGVGGDFYDVYDFPEQKKTYALIADVCGKGISAAIFMSMARTIIKTSIYSLIDKQLENVPDPAEIFRRANRLIYEDNAESYYVTAQLAMLDTATGMVRFCNAGHLPPVIVSPGMHKFHMPKIPTNLALGVIDDFRFADVGFYLSAGQILYFYTDGVSEAHNTAGEMFGAERLCELLCRTPENTSARRLIERVYEQVEEFSQGAPVYDDITQVAVHYIARSPHDKPATELPTNGEIFEFSDNACDAGRVSMVVKHLDEELQKRSIPDETRHKLCLALEEIVLNSVTHGLAEHQPHGCIQVRCCVSITLISMRIIDDTTLFNPRQNIRPPSTSPNLSELPIGGLGIFLADSLMDTMEYSVENGKNCITCTLSRQFDSSGTVPPGKS